MSRYTQLNRQLQNLLFAKKSRLNLTEIKALYNELNLKKYPIIHIAGTNGKGSCAQKISSALTASGYRCGRYTSPHVASFRERITIDNQMISKEEVVEYLPRLLNIKSGLTFFEVTTLLAFLYFSEKEVDAAVIEVGLGGRLDATNCIHPILSLITSISFDHEQILGNTLEKIASEKAGIIKDNVPVVLGPTCTQKSIQKALTLNKAPAIEVKGSFDSYDEENQAISKAAINELKKSFTFKESAIEFGLKQKQPCRYEKIKIKNHEVLLDISHNSAGLTALFRQIKKEHPNQNIVVFFSVAFNRDIQKTSDLIKDQADSIYILDSHHPMLCKASDIQENLPGVAAIPINQALEKVLNLDPNALFVFTGSIFIMDPIRRQLGFNDDQDNFPVFDGSANFSELKVN